MILEVNKMKRIFMWLTLTIFVVSLIPLDTLAEEMKFQVSKGRSKEVVGSFKEKANLAREKLAEKREEYNKLSLGYNQIKEKFKECKETDSGSCKDIKDQFKKRSKNFLINTADLIINIINTRINSLQESDLVNKEEIISSFGEKIRELEQAKTLLESSESIEVIKEASKKIKGAWTFTKNKSNGHRYLLVN